MDGLLKSQPILSTLILFSLLPEVIFVYIWLFNVKISFIQYLIFLIGRSISDSYFACAYVDYRSDNFSFDTVV